MLNFLDFILGKEVTNQYFDVCISYLSFLFQSFSVRLHGECCDMGQNDTIGKI